MRRSFLLLACLLGLTACGGEEHQDLRQWMKEAAKDLKGRVPPLPEVKKFPVVAYEAADLMDPYNPAKIEPERKAGGPRPDLDRPKEPLEAYPLESLRMVGTLKKGNTMYALVQADKSLHQVKVGNHMGQNFGRITAISETEITLKEIVPDAVGDYTERTSTLQLQEKQQEGRK